MTQYGNLAYVRITGLTPETGGDVAVAVDEEIRYETTKPWDYAQVDVDFTQGVRAEVVGCFSGHLHRDVMAQVGQVQVVVTSCDGNLAYDPSEEPRTPGDGGGAGAGHCEHQPAGPDSSAHPGGTGGGSELYLLRRRTHARGGSGCCPQPVGDAVGVPGGVIASSKLTNFRLEQLERKVQAHNNLIERTFQLEAAQAIAEQRLDRLEQQD